MKICKNCNSQNADNAAFCNNCGAPFLRNENAQAASSNSSFIDKIKNLFTNTADYTTEFDANDIADTKGISVCSYLGFLFLIPLLGKPNSRFAKFHVNQGIILFIIDLVLGIGGALITRIIASIFTVEETLWGFGTGIYRTSAIGLVLCAIIRLILYLPIIVSIIIGITNSVNGKAKELPIIGKLKIINY